MLTEGSPAQNAGLDHRRSGSGRGQSPGAPSDPGASVTIHVKTNFCPTYNIRNYTHYYRICMLYKRLYFTFT